MRRKSPSAARCVTTGSSVEPRPSLLDGFADDHRSVLAGLHYGEMGVEGREGQLTGTRPKTMNRLVHPGSSGELCPLEDLNPAHDDRVRWLTCQVVYEKYFRGQNLRSARLEPRAIRRRSSASPRNREWVSRTTVGSKIEPLPYPGRGGKI